MWHGPRIFGDYWGDAQRHIDRQPPPSFGARGVKIEKKIKIFEHFRCRSV
jgi:hypothetical protein